MDDGASRATVEALLQGMDAPAAIIDVDGVVTLANPRWASDELQDLLGPPGTPFLQLPRARAGELTGLAQLETLVERVTAAGSEPTAPGEVVVSTSSVDGRRYDAFHLHRLQPPLERWILVTSRDVTDVHRVHGALGRSRTRLRAIVTGAPIVLLSADTDGVVTLVEGVGAEQLALRPEELVGRSVFEAFSHLPAMVGAFRTALSGGTETTAVELGPRTLELRCAPMLDHLGHRDGVVAVATDISERRRIERMKDEFVSVVSHELRTPLTSIRGSLGLLLGGLAGGLPPKATELLEIAHTNTQRLIGLINDILDLDKIEAGKLEFRVEQLDCRPLIGAALLATQGMGRERGVELRQGAIACGGEPRIRGDRERLIQVLTNLLSNAIKHSHAGGVVDIESTSPRPGWLRISVLDRGPGVPAEARDRLFRKFEQSQTGPRGAGGTGLGLAICKAVVDAHHGRIGVGDRPGGGAEFYFELPVDRVDQPGTEVRAQARRGRGRTREIDLGAIPDPTRGSLDEQLVGLVRAADRAIAARTSDLLADAAATARILRDSRTSDLDHRGVDLDPLIRSLTQLRQQPGAEDVLGRALACVDALRRAATSGH